MPKTKNKRHMKLSLFHFLFILGLTACSSLQKKEKTRPPNIMFFLVDDMGWTDIACYGSKIYQTPTIDKLASEGVLFTQSYAAHPLCIGSRYGIMTGKYPARIKKSKEYGTMHPDEVTLAESFKEAGYKTFFAGKWHLGNEGAYPQDQGFDVNVAGHHMGAPASYFYPYGEDGNIRKVPGLQEEGSPGDYLTDVLTDKTIAFIKENKDKPFLAYLSHYAVHTPLESKVEYQKHAQKTINAHNFKRNPYGKVKSADEKLRQDNAIYAGMIQSIDESLSRIMRTLESLGLSENTIIVFTSDNDGDGTKVNKRGKSTSNYPLKAGKCWLYEGGIRVPHIVKWPKKIKEGFVSNAQIIGPDHYPTLLDLANLPQKKEQHVDGVSYASILKGKKREQRKAMFWLFPAGGNLTRVCGTDGGAVVQEGDYKLIDWYNSDTYELYNLKEDIGEEHDISTQMPVKAKELLLKVRKWRKEATQEI